MGWIVGTALIILTVLLGPGLVILAAGYLIQRYKFGVPFRETYNYHKEQNELERKRAE